MNRPSAPWRQHSSCQTPVLSHIHDAHSLLLTHLLQKGKLPATMLCTALTS